MTIDNSSSVKVIFIDVKLLFFFDKFMLCTIHIVPTFLANGSFVVDQHVLNVRNIELELAFFNSFS